MNLIDKLINDVTSNFLSLLAAETMHIIGSFNLDNLNDDETISPPLSPDLQIEPIPISTLKQFRDSYLQFLFEVYHGKFIQIFNDFLNDIFEVLLDLHLTGKRNFIELKKCNLKIDFSSNKDLNDQIRREAIKI